MIQPSSTDSFVYTSFPQEVIFESGALSRLTAAGDRVGWQRYLLCTNPSVQKGGWIGVLKADLGDRLVSTFDHVKPHVPDDQIAEALSLVAKKDIDAVIGMGGGSAIGMAKAIASALTKERTARSDQPISNKDQNQVSVVAIPTTYAGSEMTPVFGVTRVHEVPPRKVSTNDPKAMPRLVIYDPRLTLDLPPEQTASTGINALAHCIEALYSITRNPISSAAATSGLQHIMQSLLTCYQHGSDLAARTDLLEGAYLAGFALANIAMGLHHGLCHVLGGAANIPHGIANSIILPHAIRFNADVVAQQLLPAAEVMGIDSQSGSHADVMESMAARIYSLIGQMNLPQRLRDVGLRETDISMLAQLGFASRTVQNNPKPIRDAAQIEQLLKDAW